MSCFGNIAKTVTGCTAAVIAYGIIHKFGWSDVATTVCASGAGWLPMRLMRSAYPAEPRTDRALPCYVVERGTRLALGAATALPLLSPIGVWVYSNNSPNLWQWVRTAAVDADKTGAFALQHESSVLSFLSRVTVVGPMLGDAINNTSGTISAPDAPAAPQSAPAAAADFACKLKEPLVISHSLGGQAWPLPVAAGTQVVVHAENADYYKLTSPSGQLVGYGLRATGGPSCQ